jgi:hypothetical protein
MHRTAIASRPAPAGGIPALVEKLARAAFAAGVASAILLAAVAASPAAGACEIERSPKPLTVRVFPHAAI